MLTHEYAEQQQVEVDVAYNDTPEANALWWYWEGVMDGLKWAVLWDGWDSSNENTVHAKMFKHAYETGYEDGINEAELLA